MLIGVCVMADCYRISDRRFDKFVSGKQMPSEDCIEFPGIISDKEDDSRLSSSQAGAGKRLQWLL